MTIPSDFCQDRRTYRLVFALCALTFFTYALVLGIVFFGLAQNSGLSQPGGALPAYTHPRPSLMVAFFTLLAAFALGVGGALFAVPRLYLRQWLRPLPLLGRLAPYHVAEQDTGKQAILAALCPGFEVRHVLVARSPGLENMVIGKDLLISRETDADLQTLLAPEPVSMLSRAHIKHARSRVTELLWHERHHLISGEARFAHLFTTLIYPISGLASLSFFMAVSDRLSDTGSVLLLIVAVPVSLGLASEVFMRRFRLLEVWSELRAERFRFDHTGTPNKQITAPKDAVLRRNYPADDVLTGYLSPQHAPPTATAHLATAALVLAFCLAMQDLFLLLRPGLLPMALTWVAIALGLAATGLLGVLAKVLRPYMTGARASDKRWLAFKETAPAMAFFALVPIAGAWSVLMVCLMFALLWAPLFLTPNGDRPLPKNETQSPDTSETLHAMGRFFGVGIAAAFLAIGLFSLFDPDRPNDHAAVWQLSVVIALWTMLSFLFPKSRLALWCEIAIVALIAMVLVSMHPVFVILATSTDCATALNQLICVGDLLMTKSETTLPLAINGLKNDLSILVPGLFISIFFVVVSAWVYWHRFRAARHLRTGDANDPPT